MKSKSFTELFVKRSFKDFCAYNIRYFFSLPLENCMNLLLIVCFVLSFRIFCLYRVVVSTVRGSKSKVYSRCLRSFSREGFLSGHIWCDKGQRFFCALHIKGHPKHVCFYNKKWVLSTYSWPDTSLKDALCKGLIKCGPMEK